MYNSLLTGGSMSRRDLVPRAETPEAGAAQSIINGKLGTAAP